MASQRSALFVGYLFDELHDAAAYLGVFDARERLAEDEQSLFVRDYDFKCREGCRANADNQSA